ncbi:MAG: polysaccharide biosynthesis protein [Clostridiales bacterium]|nr:polysaccharide biosynthesis protein [Clostridiales bacterium]
MQRIVRLVTLILIDGILVNLSYMLAFLLRFDFVTESTAFSTYFEVYLNFWFVLTAIKLVIFSLCGLYSSLWRFAGAQELLRLVGAAAVANAVASVFLLIFSGEMQRSLIFMPFVIDMLLVGGVRLFYRFAGSLRNQKRIMSSSKDVKRIMLVGTGYAAAAIIKEMRVHTGEMMMIPAVVVDENKNKVGNRISGIKIAGTRKDIPRLVRRYKVDEIFIALPSANKKEIEVIMAECSKTNCQVKILPAMHELIDGKVSVSKLRNVDIDDLLGRESVEINSKEITDSFKGRIVLVTGAGGTMGSEICRQVGKYLPRKIIGLDASENGIFELQYELKKLYPDVEIQTELCSVTEAAQIKEVFQKSKPHIIIHAASHKNTQLMEDNAKEAVRNNIFGTLTLVNACEEFAAEKFILISSDKALRPGGVAGAVTRAMEMIVQLKSTISKTQYMAVRLGNIMGSNGSVVPLFKRQVEQGGPVTVTHPDAVRHFMSLQQAVMLVLQAAAISQGGEIFTVNIGKAVRIMDLAENIIKLYGFKPYDEIAISIIGLRPGEKLYEELLPSDKELVRPTSHSRIVTIDMEEPNDFEFDRRLGILWESVKHNDDAQIKKDLEGLVPGYRVRN